MPVSKAEEVLTALQAALGGPLGVPAASLMPRNSVLPARIAAGGAVILRDGNPGEPEVTMSPLAYHYEHRAEIDLIVELPPAQADTAFDALRRQIGAAIAADRTLGGLCDWIEAEAPAPLNLPIEGGEPLKTATIAVVLHYSSADALI